VAFKSDSTPKIIATFDGDRDVGEQAEQPVGQKHEHDDHDRADIGRKFAFFRSSPGQAPAPRCAPSMIVSGAGRAPARSRIDRSLAACTVKLPEICPEPPVIGSRITGAEITSLSSTMAKGLTDILRGGLREFA